MAKTEGGPYVGLELRNRCSANSAHLRDAVMEAQQSILSLESQVASIGSGAHADPQGSADPSIEYGTAILALRPGNNKAHAWIEFKNRYVRPPVVLCSDNGPSGTFLYLKAERVEEHKCLLGCEKIGEHVQNMDMKIGYLVVGERVKTG